MPTALTATPAATPIKAASLADVLVGQLARAPIGRHALHEVALLWSGHRPAGWRGLAPPSLDRHITIIRLDRLDPALRATRMLSDLAWTVVRDGPGDSFDVAVAAKDWHRIVRYLASTRRDGAKRLGMRGVAHRLRPLAVASWRAAMLGSLQELDAQSLTILVRDNPLRDLLLAAAPVLDLGPTRYALRANETRLIVNGRQKVLSLVELATTGPSEARQALV